jgi:hypothetical protein
MSRFYTYGDIPDVRGVFYEEGPSGLGFFSEPSFDYSPVFSQPLEDAPLSYFQDDRQLELDRQAEERRQFELFEAQRRQAEQEYARRLEQERAIELARQQQIAREQEAARQAEAARVAEMVRQQEMARQEALRQQEMARQEALRQQEIARQQEMARQEAARRAEEARMAEEARRAEEARQAEQQRQAELRIIQEQENARRAEETRRAEDLRRAEQQRIAEETRRAEQARLAREAQLAREAEVARRAEEEATSRRQAEAARREQERVATEQARLEQERVAEAQRQAEVQRQAELQRQEAERQETARRQAEMAEMQRRQAEQENSMRVEQERQAQLQRQQELADLQRREEARRAEEERARIPTPQEEVAISQPPLSQVGDELIPQAPPEDPMRGVSGPEMFRWSDGTYHFRPEESGQRTPIDQLPDYYRRLTEEALAKSPLQDIPDYMRQNLVGPSRTPPEMPEELIPTPRGENVPISPLTSLPSGPDPISDSWGYRGENVPVAPLESLPGPGLAGDDGRLPRGEDVPVAPLSSTVDFIRSQLGEQPQAPSSPLADTAAAAPSISDWTALSEQATAEFINSLSPEDRQALFDADMAGMARGSPLKESPLALNFSGAGFGGTYSLSPQALFTEGTGGADLETGSLYAPLSSPSIERGKELQKQREAFVTSKAGEMPGAADLKKAAEAMQAEAKREISAEEEKYLATLPQRRELSSLLKQGKFAEAFKYAADNGVTELITNPAELKNLRGAFSKDELGKFFSSMPEDLKPIFAPSGLQDEKFNFDPQKGVEYSVGQWRGETGFPLVSSAFMAKKDKTVENLAKVAGLAMLTAGFAPGLLGGAPAGGAAGAGGAGAGAGAAGAGAAGAGGALSAAELASILPEIVITSSKVSPLLTAAGAAGAGLAASQLGGGAAAAPTASTAPTTPVDPLQEILVTGSKVPPASLSAIGPGTLASLNLMRGVSDIPVDIYGRPVEPPPAEAPPETPPEEPLKEILVTAPKPISALDIAAGATVPALSKTIADMGYRAPAFEGTPIENIPEVVVQGTAPKPIDLTSVVGPLTAAQLTQGFTQPQVDPTTGELKEPPKTQQELDAIEEALKTGKPIPGTASVVDKIKDAYDTYKKIRQISSLLGGLGAAAAGYKKPVTTVTTPTGPSGALPKYELKRTQLQPQIDYYRYGLGPEARFFSDVLNPPPPPEPPQLPPSKPPGDEPVFAAGGLTGYARGGSKKSRYVAGPGSGRDDKIPALLSDGEYVIDAETLALLGDGSTKEGARRMDKFRAKIRKHKGRALSRGRISPNAKSPDKYMGGGLT